VITAAKILHGWFLDEACQTIINDIEAKNGRFFYPFQKKMESWEKKSIFGFLIVCKSFI
jgi:ABC-type tungstate transport system permease subunit